MPGATRRGRDNLLRKATAAMKRVLESLPAGALAKAGASSTLSERNEVDLSLPDIASAKSGRYAPAAVGDITQV